MKKAIISLSLVCAICLGLAGLATAVYDPTLLEMITEGTVTSRGFPKDRTNYYVVEGNFEIVLEDPNFDIVGDALLTVAPKSSEGPKAFTISVYCKEDSATEWTLSESATVELGESACSFTIPENHTFKIEVRATDGNNGNATFQVSLS